MRYALFISIFVHLLLIFNIDLDSDKQHKLSQSNLSARLVQVRLSNLELFQQGNSQANTIDSKKFSNGDIQKTSPYEKSEAKPIRQTQQTEVISHLFSTANKGNDENLYAAYLKPDDVDIVAMPLRELEISNNQRVNPIIFTYHLRIYIDKNGEVEHLVNLDNSTAKLASYAEVASQIKKMTFIPAKKNGVVVDSYIDISLEI